MTAGREAQTEGAAACGRPPVPPGPAALPACCDPLAAAATCCCLRCRPGPPLTKLKSPDMEVIRVPWGWRRFFQPQHQPHQGKKLDCEASKLAIFNSRYTCTFWAF